MIHGGGFVLEPLGILLPWTPYPSYVQLAVRLSHSNEVTSKQYQRTTYRRIKTIVSLSLVKHRLWCWGIGCHTHMIIGVIPLARGDAYSKEQTIRRCPTIFSFALFGD